jgi:hypothetical protein
MIRSMYGMAVAGEMIGNAVFGLLGLIAIPVVAEFVLMGAVPGSRPSRPL